MAGSCPLDHVVRGFQPDGAPLCAPAVNLLSTVDSEGLVGGYNSLALGADGLPVIAYHDASNDDLVVSRCNDAACAGGDETLSTVDSAGAVGFHASIALGADGLPVISYLDFTNGDLEVAKCNDAACAGGNDAACTGGDETLSIIDIRPGVFLFLSIALGADGLPVIAYYRHDAETTVHVAKCEDASCSAVRVSTLDHVDIDLAQSATSVALGADGLPVISYHDGTRFNLKVAKCASQSCA